MKDSAIDARKIRLRSNVGVIRPPAIAALHKSAGTGTRATVPCRAAPVRIAGLFGHNPHQNHILAALPDTEFEQLSSHLELAAMPLGGICAEEPNGMQHAYFPTSSVVSLLLVTVDGASAETALIGSEGVVGLSYGLESKETSCRAVVKCAGFGFRMRATVLKEEFDRGGALQDYLLRFSQALMHQTAQNAICYRHHSVMQQLCRWLLQCIDRQPSQELHMTQELIANLLGVRRESVAEAAGRLLQAGLISYSRGHITILDRCGLEQRACECYAAVAEEYAALLPRTVPLCGLPHR